MHDQILRSMEVSPVIAAVKDDGGLKRALECEQIQIIFVLYGDILSVQEIVSCIKKAGKIAIVHADLLTGLSSKEVAVDFIAKAGADGILSTRQNFIHRARERGLFAIWRVFLLDSIALGSLEKVNTIRPHCIEVLPGAMPKVLRKVCQLVDVPVLTGGLIADKEDVLAALDAGAMAISTTSEAVWDM